MKKISSVMLAIVMLLSVSVTAFAAEYNSEASLTIEEYIDFLAE